MMNFIRNTIRTARQKVNDLCVRTAVRTAAVIEDTRGDLATNTIGGIIVAVVIVGLLVVAVKAFFPDFFTKIFKSMETKLNANW